MEAISAARGKPACRPVVKHDGRPERHCGGGPDERFSVGHGTSLTVDTASHRESHP